VQITTFDELLDAARQQPEPQRLLLLFAAAELPDGSTAAERARFEAGQGGALVPQVCVDKTPEELQDFAALAEEAKLFTQGWSIVFVAALSGSSGQPPDARAIDTALERMVESVKAGRFDGMIPFNRSGHGVQLG
jgi:hypothetical protein